MRLLHAIGCVGLIVGLTACLKLKDLQETNEGTGLASAALSLDDTCSSVDVVAQSSMDMLMVSTGNLNDDMSEFSSCHIEEQLVGPEGFIALNVSAGERWHIMLRPIDPPDMDVAGYVLSSCDNRSCIKGRDECGGGKVEHFNFSSATSGEYLIGVESSVPGMVAVMIVKPPCGDGKRQHGETCDDGNLEVGDGCTPSCQYELLEAESSEEEPNDDTVEANVVVFDEGRQTLVITGTLGGGCDIDRFSVEVPEGASLQAVLTGSGGCDGSGAVLTSMELQELHSDEDHDGHQLGNGMAGRSGGSCPSIELTDAFASNLEGAIHQIRLQAPEDTPQFDYALEITLSLAIAQ